jgi:hypothetical protein
MLPEMFERVARNCDMHQSTDTLVSPVGNSDDDGDDSRSPPIHATAVTFVVVLGPLFPGIYSRALLGLAFIKHCQWRRN